MVGIEKIYKFDTANEFWEKFYAENVGNAHHWQDDELSESTGKLVIRVVWALDSKGDEYTEQPNGWSDFEITE